MYVDYRQRNWSEWLVIAEFTFNNKVHTAMKSSPFKVNYGREPRMVSQIRYSLVVILELNDVSEVQYKDVMMIDDGKYQ